MKPASSNLVEALGRRADGHPDRAALCAMRGGQPQVLTFRELDRRVARGAAMLRDMGIARGDHVLFLHPVAPALYEGLLACMRIGAVAVFIDLAAGPALVRHACARLPPRALFIGGPAFLLRWRHPVLRRIPLLIRSGPLPWRTGRRWPAVDRVRDPDEAADAGIEPVEAGHPALVTFTSGSTGLPKAVVRSHGFLQAQHRALASALDHQAGQADLVTLPVFALANLASGMTSVLADTDLRRPGRPSLRRLRRQFERTVPAPSRCAASPAFFSALGTDPGLMRGWRRIDTGGAPVFPDTIERLRRALSPEARLVVVYGSTEAEPIAHLDAGELDAGMMERIAGGGGLPVGRPVADIRLAIIADRTGEPLGPLPADGFDALTRPPMEPGEIVVSGAHVVRGYLDGHGDREGKIRVGDEVWHRTGDAGYLDREGRLWLLGRCSAADRRGGGTLYPFAVEAAARLRLGRPCAFVLHEGRRLLCCQGKADGGELRELAGQMPWAGIEQVVSLRRLPLDRRHNAKIDYPALRRWLARRFRAG